MADSTHPDDVAHAEAEAKVLRALDHVQNAQRELGLAGAELSGLIGGIPIWNANTKLYDQVHRFWYRLEGFRKKGRFSLDGVATAALAQRPPHGS